MSYVGQRLKRREDPRLLQGQGAYVADVRRPDTLHLAVNYHFKAEGYVQLDEAVAPFDMTSREI